MQTLKSALIIEINSNNKLKLKLSILNENCILKEKIYDEFLLSGQMATCKFQLSLTRREKDEINWLVRVLVA